MTIARNKILFPTGLSVSLTLFKHFIADTINIGFKSQGRIKSSFASGPIGPRFYDDLCIKSKEM